MILNKVAEFTIKTLRIIDAYIPKKKNTKTLAGKKVILDGEISYPIPIKGLQPISIPDILEPNNERIGEAIRLLGLRSLHHKYNEKNLVLEVIQRFASYVHLLPASEDHHHQSAGGLLAHSLDVAVGALKIASSKDLMPKGYPDEEAVRKDCYRYSVFIAGLLHDIGKVFTDMRVVSVADGLQWQPRIEPLTVWAKKNKIERYKVDWLPERVHKQHESVSTYVMDKILPVEAKEYLLECKLDDMFHEIDAAIGFYAERKGFIYDSVRQADSISTVRSFSGDTDPLLGRKVMSLSSQIIRSIHRHRNKWAINELNGEVWVINRQVFLAFPTTMEQLRDDLLAHQVATPSDITVLMNVMLEQHIISNPDPSSRLSFWLPGEYTHEEAIKIQKEHLDGTDSRSWFPVYRLKWYSYYFGDMPLPDSAPGILSINQDGYMVHYSDYADPVDMPPAVTKGGKTVVAKPSIQNIVATTGGNTSQISGAAPTSLQTPKVTSSANQAQSSTTLQPPKVNASSAVAPKTAKPTNANSAGSGSKTAKPTNANSAGSGSKTTKVTIPKGSRAVTLKPVPKPEAQEKPNPQQDDAEKTLPEVIESSAENEVADLVNFIQEQTTQGVMLLREQNGLTWLNITRMADFYFKTPSDLTTELRKLAMIVECSQRFDPIKKKAYSVTNVVGGDLEALLSDHVVTMLVGDKQMVEEKPQESIKQESHIEHTEPLIEPMFEDHDSSILLVESDPDSTPEVGGGEPLIMPESCMIEDQTDQIYKILEMARMTKVKVSERDIIEDGNVLRIRLGWIRFAMGNKRDGISQEWIDSVRVNIDKISYIEIRKR